MDRDKTWSNCETSRRKCISKFCPPLPEQKKIASILTSVDEVIENTQKQIDKLQDLKKATMNELLTKGIGHTEFKDSELGRIPKSWEVKKKNLLCKSFLQIKLE
jgi:type I restriction enzyme S subunit